VDQIILLNQASKNSHPHICESLELFAREVMPEFTAKEPEHQEWKRKIFSREIGLEDIDTTPYKDRAGVGKGLRSTGWRLRRRKRSGSRCCRGFICLSRPSVHG
jgi:hypothetical protein